MQTKLIAGLPVEVPVNYPEFAAQLVFRKVTKTGSSVYDVCLAREYLGLLELFSSSKAIVIEQIEVSKNDERNRGFGAALLKTIIELAKNLDKEYVVVTGIVNYGLLRLLYKINPETRYSILRSDIPELYKYYSHSMLWPELQLLQRIPTVMAILDSDILSIGKYFKKSVNGWQSSRPNEYILEEDQEYLKVFLKDNDEYIYQPAQFYLQDVLFNAAVPINNTHFDIIQR